MIGERKKSKLVFLKTLLVFLLGSACTLGGVYLYEKEYSPKAFSSGACYTPCKNNVTVTDTGISAAVNKVYDAVVLVENYKNSNLYASGTGFIYKVDEKFGYILTNYHVIKGNAQISIILSDDSKVYATYLGGDEYLDMAVLSIPKEKIKAVAEFGDSTKTNIGDTVFTIGTPVGSEYRGTVTRGILSGKDRMVSVSISGTKDDYVMKVLQTDAAVNPGNSGGPLLNTNGEVIGMISLKFVKDEVEGMGFALTIEDIKNYIDTFEKGDAIKRPYLGIAMINVEDASYTRKSDITIDKTIHSGVVIADINENSILKDKLKKGDVITKINNIKTDNIAYLRYELYKHKIEEEISITYIRGKEEQTIKVVLKENE